MRRPLFPVLAVTAGLIVAACSDDRQAPVAPVEPPAFSLTATPTVSDLRAQIDALLDGTARWAAQLALSRVDYDIRYRRSTLYISSLVLAGIPIFERRLNRIPEEKIAQLLQLLCGLAELIRPHLPPTFPRIDWCNVDPAHLTDDVAFRLVTNATGATITTGTQKFSLDIEAGSLKDALGQPVAAVFIAVLPLVRTSSSGEVGIEQVTDPFPCPTPWDPDFAAFDCYPEFYEVAVQPGVAFDPAAHLEICQIDPSAGIAQTPTQAVLDRLRLFSKDGNNKVTILGQGAESPAEAEANCAEIEHTGPIGSVGLSLAGMWNAVQKVGRFASDVLDVFRPTPLYAANVPTHGDVGDEWLREVGFVVGAIDPFLAQLVSPPAGAVIPQNRTDIGCSLLPGQESRGHGYQIVLDWTDVAGAASYEIFATHVGAALAIVNTTVTESQHTHTACNSFVTDANLEGWIWRVRPKDNAGNVGASSEERPFSFSPCRLADGTACAASPTVSLVFVTQPSATRSGTAISPAVVVRAQDNAGAVLGSVNVTIADGSGNAALGCGMGGTSQQAITNAVGEATFNIIVVGGACSGATLAATGALFGFAQGTAISAPFTIIGFAPAASLGTARGDPEATTLGNGKVLVTGGVNASGAVASGELWDPALGSFSPAETMVAARWGHAATLLSSGRVLLTGGLGASGGALATAELWDPTVPGFSPTGSMGAARAFHRAALLPTNNLVLVTGGLDPSAGGVLASAELYDPVKGGFAPTGAMTNARARHTATVLQNETVLIAAGESNGEIPWNTAELYNPSTGGFSPTGNLVNARTRHTATLLPSGKVLIVGGMGTGSVVLATAELYDPGTGTFTATGSMSTPRQFHTATLLPNGSVLVAGGVAGPENAPGPVSLATAEIYDPQTGVFTPTASMVTARHRHAAAIQPDSKVLIIGGMDAATNTALASVERYFAKP